MDVGFEAPDPEIPEPVTDRPMLGLGPVSLAKHLNGSRDAVYIVVYSGVSACAREAEWPAVRAQKYLVTTNKVDPNRIIAVDGGFRDRLTVEIFTSPVDSCGPFPMPSRYCEFGGSTNDKHDQS